MIIKAFSDEKTGTSNASKLKKAAEEYYWVLSPRHSRKIRRLLLRATLPEQGLSSRARLTLHAAAVGASLLHKVLPIWGAWLLASGFFNSLTGNDGGLSIGRVLWAVLYLVLGGILWLVKLAITEDYCDFSESHRRHLEWEAQYIGTFLPSGKRIPVSERLGSLMDDPVKRLIVLNNSNWINRQLLDSDVPEAYELLEAEISDEIRNGLRNRIHAAEENIISFVETEATTLRQAEAEQAEIERKASQAGNELRARLLLGDPPISE